MAPSLANITDLMQSVSTTRRNEPAPPLPRDADPKFDRFRCGGRESKFLLMQCHPEDSFTKLSFNKIQNIHDSYIHTR
jgi:hypothetical protein